jgi:hypothetical protein
MTYEREKLSVLRARRLRRARNVLGKYSPGGMIKRMPQPPWLLFGADETLHFIQLGGVSCLGTHDA